MLGFDPATSFGDEVSRRYDEVDTRGDEAATVEFLARIAGCQDALEVDRYDPVSQILDKNDIRIGADGLTFSPSRLRLAHPPEFDLMARIAGLRLRDRYSNWNDEPCTAVSWRDVSVYERDSQSEPAVSTSAGSEGRQ